ncbi:MAG: hypothetical protein EBR45_05755 [Betaproteobacteria bacterium]|nr:hypothetical protein [Betaproteobacteria bacterium]
MRTDCAIIPVFAGRRLGASGSALDALLDGALTAALDRGDLADAANSVLLIPGNLVIQRVVLVATVAMADHQGSAATKGKPKRKGLAADVTEDQSQANAAITERGFQEVCKAAFRAACGTGARSVLSFLAEVPLAMGLFIGCANIVSVLVMGHFLFGEPLPKSRLMAIGLIVVGVALVGWGGL